jgi:hypothetical protein
MKQTCPKSLCTLLGVLLLSVGTAWAEVPTGTSSDGVRAFFSGSSDLPDEIAYREFLKILNATNGAADLRDQYIIAAALGFDLEDPADYARARASIKLFSRKYMSMRKEQLGAKISVLCANNRISRSDDQIYDALNAVDDIDQAVVAKHFLITMNRLNADEQHSFSKFLSKMKAGISYMKIDSRSVGPSTYENIRVTADRSCYEYERDHQRLGEVR